VNDVAWRAAELAARAITPVAIAVLSVWDTIRWHARS
jgi:hypothetical protein